MASMVDNAHIECVTVYSSHIDRVHVMVDNAHIDHVMMDNAHIIVVASSPAVDPLVSFHMMKIALMEDNADP
jgi:hypothetical protein